MGFLGGKTGSSLAVDDRGVLARAVEGVWPGCWVGRSEPVVVGWPSGKSREFPSQELGGEGGPVGRDIASVLLGGEGRLLLSCLNPSCYRKAKSWRWEGAMLMCMCVHCVYVCMCTVHEYEYLCIYISALMFTRATVGVHLSLWSYNVILGVSMSESVSQCV